MRHADGHRYKTLTLDAEKYQSMLDAPDVSEEDKAELIDALWQMVVSFIDLNIDFQIENSGGKDGGIRDAAPSAERAMIDWNKPTRRELFNTAANIPAAPLKNKEAS
jgi:hypothetical protein